MIPDYIIQAGRRRSAGKNKKKPKLVLEKGHVVCRSCGSLTNTVWAAKVKGSKGWLCGKCIAY